MATKNSDKITLANLVSIIGIVLLAFLFYCGIAISGMSIGISILIAVGISAVIGFILWLLLHAKGVENDFAKWRAVEIVSLVLFILVSLGSSWFILKFTNVLFQKDAIQRVARNDIDEVRSLISKYKADATADYDNVKRDIISASESRYYPDYNIDAALRDTLASQWRFSVTELRTKASVDNFLNGTDSLTIGIRIPRWIDRIADLSTINERDLEPIVYGPSWDEQLNRCSQIINSWDIFSLPQAMQIIKKMKSDVPDKLTTISRSLPLHQLKTEPTRDNRGRSYNVYKIESAYQGHPYTLASADTDWFRGHSVKSYIVGIIISLFLYFIVIFNYIVAYRSRKVEIRVGNGRYSHGRPIM